jgi:hypothetical protein
MKDLLLHPVLHCLSGLVLAFGSSSVLAGYWTEPWQFDMPQEAPAWRAGQTAWTAQNNYGADPWVANLVGLENAGPVEYVYTDFIFVGQPLIIDPFIWQNPSLFQTGGPNALTDNSRRGSSVTLHYSNPLPAISVKDAYFNWRPYMSSLEEQALDDTLTWMSPSWGSGWIPGPQPVQLNVVSAGTSGWFVQSLEGYGTNYKGGDGGNLNVTYDYQGSLQIINSEASTEKGSGLAWQPAGALIYATSQGGDAAGYGDNTGPQNGGNGGEVQVVVGNASGSVTGNC